MRRTLLALSLLAACTSKSNAPLATDVPLAHPPVLTELAKHPVFGAHLGRGVSLAREERGFRYAASPTPFRPTGAHPLSAVLPDRADRPLRIEAGEGFFVELRDVAAAPVVGTVDQGAVVFTDATRDTDVVHVAEEGRVEELRVLRTARAASDVRYVMTKGPNVGIVRAREGRVEVLDRSGAVRMETAPAFAVDAAGVRRMVSLGVEIDGERTTIVAHLDTTGLQHPIVVDPTWQYTSNVPGRAFTDYQLVTYTPDLALLYGSASGSAVADPHVWRYDATIDKWQAMADGKYPNRNRHGMTWVPSLSKFLVSGGNASTGITTSAELYDPSGAGSFVTTGNMAVQRMVHTSTLLASGKVLVVGGASADSYTPTPTAESWDPGTGTWSARATMSGARYAHTATLLTSGKLLVAGGRGPGGWISTAEVYDPVANAWTPTASALASTRAYHGAALLPSGKVIVFGGSSSGSGSPLDTSEIYDPASNGWSAGPTMKAKRDDLAYVTLPSGKVLAIGGGTLGMSGQSSSEVYDPAANSWTLGATMGSGRMSFKATLLGGGRVLVGTGVAPSGGYVNTTEVLYPDPTVCVSTGPGCANCVDGYCCDKPCTGQCEACDLTGRQGICMSINGESPHGSRTACAPFLTCALNNTTGASACATSCVGDSACAATAYCDTSGAASACLPKKAAGLGCAAAHECTSNFCVDGVCCDKACNGQCEACAESGKLGVCTAVSGPPRGARTACSGGYGCSVGSCASGCATDGECAANRYCSAGTCAPQQSNGASCANARQCASGNCVDGYCCNSACAGNCQACDVAGALGTCSNVPSGPLHGTTRNCGAYTACSAGACASTCATSSDCTTGFYCLAGSCVVRKTAGAGCGTSGECTSGFCASGVCCDSACTSECQTCNGAGAVGTCRPKPSTAICGLAGCAGSYTVTKGTCSGTDGTCTLGTVAPCANGLVCADSFTCKTSCTSGADCVTGACDVPSGKCITSFDGGVDTGTPDAGADTFVPDTFVPDTFVPDAFVPDTAVAEVAEETRPTADMPAPKLDPKPTVAEFQRCSKDSACPSGFCVEGVCCDSRCNDRCHSCALLSNPGRCTLEPIGVDLKNECGPGDSCLGTCGHAGECVGSGAGTMCDRNRCTGPSSGTGPAYCPAPGASCPTGEAVPFECSPYICEPAFGACRNSCNATLDCANGFICDVGSKTCVAAPAAGDATGASSGGCAVSHPQGRNAAWAALAVLGLASLVARRRRSGREI